MPSSASVLPRLLRHLAVAAALVAVVACGEGGDSDDAEMAKDPSTQPEGARITDSSTQVAPAPAPPATTTATGTGTPADSTRSASPTAGRPR